MKRLIVLLIVLAGGLAAAAFSVPVERGHGQRQRPSASRTSIPTSTPSPAAPTTSATSTPRRTCRRTGAEQLPPVTGAGTGQYAGDHPTATTAFVANYLETKIGHQLVLQLADERHVTRDPGRPGDGPRQPDRHRSPRSCREILQTQQGQDVRYGCSLTGQPLTGKQVLDTLPASFVDEQVQFVATATALQEDLAGVGLERGRPAELLHGAQRESSTRRASPPPSSPARRRRRTRQPRSPSGRPFATVASNTSSSGGGAQGCDVLSDLGVQAAVGRRPRAAWRPGPSRRPSTTTGPTSCCRSPRGRRRRTARPRRPWRTPCRQAGSAATQKAAHRRRAPSSVSVEPAVRRVGARQRLGAHAASRRSRPTCSTPRRTSAAQHRPRRRPQRPARPSRPAAERAAPAPTSRWWASGRPAPTCSGRRRRPPGRGARTGLPAHGAPPGRRRLRGRARLRPPLRGGGDVRRGLRRDRRGPRGGGARGGARAGRLRRARIAARGGAHRRPAAGRRPGRGRPSCRRSPSWTWPGRRSASTRWPQGCGWSTPARSSRVAAQGGGPFLVAQCWSRQLLSEVKLAAPDDGRGAAAAGAPAPSRASRTRWWRRSTGGSSTARWSRTT